MGSFVRRCGARTRPIVAVITGNEKQAKLAPRILETLSSQYGLSVDLRLTTPCFTRNWGKPLAEFARDLSVADVAVVGTYLPTELGKAARAEVRRRGVPHIRSSALSASALAAAIAEALSLVAA